METNKPKKQKKQYVYGAKEKPRGKSAVMQVGIVFAILGVLLVAGIKTGFVEQVTKDLMSIDTKIDKSENIAKKQDSEEKGVYVEGKIKHTWLENDDSVESYMYLKEKQPKRTAPKRILYIEIKVKPNLFTGETSKYIGLLMSERSYQQFKGQERIGYYLKGNEATEASVPK